MSVARLVWTSRFGGSSSVETLVGGSSSPISSPLIGGAAVVRTRGEATYRYRGKGGSVNRIRVTNARVCCTPSPHQPFAVSVKEVNAVGRHFAIRSDAIQMRSTRVRSDAVAQFIYGATYRILSFTTMSTCAGWCCRSRQYLNETWQTTSKGKGPSHSSRQGIWPSKSECMCVSTLLSKSVSVEVLRNIIMHCVGHLLHFCRLFVNFLAKSNDSYIEWKQL